MTDATAHGASDVRTASAQTVRPMRVLLCEDSLEGILSGVAAAYRSRYGHAFQRLALKDAQETLSLFSEYREIATDAAEAGRVMDAVCQKIGGEAARWVESAAASVFPDRADAVYRFLIRGFANGPRALTALGDPKIARMMEIDRHFSNEATHWQEFIRFQVIAAGASAAGSGHLPRTLSEDRELLAAFFSPKHRVLQRILPFFADRFHGEDFVICDETHDMAGLHARKGAWFFYRDFRTSCPDLFWLLSEESREEKRMQDLWRIFFAATDIPERYNPRVQRGLLPLWKRKNMVEFTR